MKSTYSPLSETAYYILLSLTEECHGYGVMQFVTNITKGRINLGAGTIYGTLGKLEKATLIRQTKKDDKRKYYIITDTGKELLRSEIQRIGELYHNGKEILDYV